MRADDEMIIKHLLQNDESRIDNFVPIEYFSITSGIFEFIKSQEGIEDSFSLGAIEAEILSFCILSADNIFLKAQIDELNDLLLTEFSKEMLQRCLMIFEEIKNLYIEKYLKSVILLEVR